jgi:molecular chaperone GrpE
MNTTAEELEQEAAKESQTSGTGEASGEQQTAGTDGKFAGADADAGSAEENKTDTGSEGENETVGKSEADADNGEDAESDTAGDAEETSGKKKDGFFKKKKDKKDEQIEELNDRLRRQMAEFDNFRKRTEKEKSQMFDMGARSIIEKILPVVDNFERGLAAVPEEQKEDAFVSGMDKVYKQLMTELEAAQVTPIECVGMEFDPELHNAVMQVENEELESGVVAQELQKGYKYKDTVVRHSMVAVVQ